MSEEEINEMIKFIKSCNVYVIKAPITEGDGKIALENYKGAVNSVIILYEQEKEKNKKLEEKYKRLSIEAQATAFTDDNIDTEGLLRVLLKQGEITLNEKGEYQRKDFDWEENMVQLGLMKKREKTFYIPDDECLDEYTKQLESQLKEYDELKRIFRERNITNETMYDGFCRLFDELNEEKEKNKEAREYMYDLLNADTPNVGTDDINNLLSILEEK